MAQKIVVDSSVIVKWLNTDNEQDLERSDNLLKEARDGKIELLTPELAKYEVGNVLLLGKKLSSQQANTTLYWLFHLPITFIPQSEKLSKDTFTIADNLRITFYDASFLALAKHEDAVLITDNLKHQGRKDSGVKVVALKDYWPSDPGSE